MLNNKEIISKLKVIKNAYREIYQKNREAFNLNLGIGLGIVFGILGNVYVDLMFELIELTKSLKFLIFSICSVLLIIILIITVRENNKINKRSMELKEKIYKIGEQLESISSKKLKPNIGLIEKHLRKD